MVERLGNSVFSCFRFDFGVYGGSVEKLILLQPNKR
jgi:hypothetical protein